MVKPARPGKRPLKVRTNQEKLDAIDRIKIKKESKASVARAIRVPESTLRGWCKSEDKIRSLLNNSGTPSSSRTPKARKISEQSSSYSEDEIVNNPAKRVKKDDLSSAQQHINLINHLVDIGRISRLQADQVLIQAGLKAPIVDSLKSPMNSVPSVTSAPKQSSSNSQDEIVNNPAKRAKIDDLSKAQLYISLIKSLVENQSMSLLGAKQHLTEAGLPEEKADSLINLWIYMNSVPSVTSAPKTFGLVENGLVYTLPIKQTPAVSTPKPSPQAEEEVLDLSMPKSPERCNTEASNSADDSKSSTESAPKVMEENLHNWLPQKNLDILGQPIPAFKPSTNKKNCSAEKSPAEAKALIDMVLLKHNDKENVNVVDQEMKMKEEKNHAKRLRLAEIVKKLWVDLQLKNRQLVIFDNMV